MNTQKRISAPKTYHIRRKEKTWIMRSRPGPHNKTALSLTVLLREVLGMVRNAKEAGKILNEGKVLVDGKVRKDPKFPIGFCDIISIPLLKKFYRVIYDNNDRLKVVESSKKEAELKLVQIKGKKRLSKHYQISTNDGRSINVKLTDGKKYKLSDSLLIKVPSQELVKHLPINDGVIAYIVGGKQVGNDASIIKIKDRYAKVMIDKKEHRTVKKYLFVIGEKNSELKLHE